MQDRYEEVGRGDINILFVLGALGQYDKENLEEFAAATAGTGERDSNRCGDEALELEVGLSYDYWGAQEGRPKENRGSTKGNQEVEGGLPAFSI